VRRETNENRHATNDAAGQRTCLVEAMNDAPSPACPFETFAGAFGPHEGYLVLDVFNGYYGPARAPDPAALERGDAAAFVFGAQPGSHMNLHRASGGLFAEALLPGPAWWRAWYGPWEDRDGDDMIDFRPRFQGSAVVGMEPDNEWIPLQGSTETMYAWVEPGAHQPAYATHAPGPDQPDFDFKPSANSLWSSTSGPTTTFYDGSVLTTYTMVTVTNPTLAPSCDERGCRPYTPSTRSRADIDVYASLAPGPVSALYEAFATGTVHTLPAPGFALCPRGCAGPPVPVDGAARPYAGLVEGAVYAPYAQETSIDPGDARQASHASGDAARFREGFRAWIDLVPTVGVGDRQFLMPGRADDGRPTMMPGKLSWSVIVGVWFDANEDGFIGAVERADPYKSGTNPWPDDYGNALGEFLPHTVVNPLGPISADPKEIFWVTLTPDDTWGPAGVFIGTGAGNPMPVTTSTNPPGAEARPPSEWHVTGTEKARFPLRLSTTAPGVYLSTLHVWMPQGSPGFTLCTPTPADTGGALILEMQQDGVDVDERVWDCDHLPRWTR